MRVLRGAPQLCTIILIVVAGAASGWGGGGVGPAPMVPISVSLNPSTVVLAPGGTPVYAKITINSTSETALVNLIGLPGGVSESYVSTDTNPSGLLTFTASKSAVDGTYMPIVMVNSAGQTASLTFTLLVRSAVTAGNAL